MFNSRRFPPSALLLIGCALAPGLRAQDRVIPLTNWAAPLYWQPPQSEEQKSAREQKIARATELELQVSGFAPQTVVNGVTTPLVFVGMTPCRVMDTRTGYGFSGNFGPPSITGGTSRTVPIQSSTCPIPSTAQAYSFNVTVVPAGSLGFLTLWPTGQAQPNVSTLNDGPGQVLANAAIVPAGTSGSVNIYVTNTTDVLVDINGYYVAPSALALGAGTASAPSLTFSHDANSGFYSPAAGTVEVTASGANILTVNSSGIAVAGTINANNSATTGNANGVQGTSNSPNGAGVNGFNSVTSSGFPVGVQGGVNGAFGAGVAGNASQAGAAGVNGFNSATSGYAVGVSGGTASTNGAGVSGNASHAGAVGVNGFNSATSGYAVGVSGGTASTNGAGVSGNSNVAGVFGTVGFNGATSGYAVGTEGASSSPGGVGLLGVDWNCAGGTGCQLVAGRALQLQTATTGTLIQGQAGVAGANNNTAVTVFSVDGQGDGFFSGNLTVGGTVSKSGGSFRIDHPLDPENKYLYHSFVESPDMKNIYDGVVVLDDRGEATVTLPDWFEALNQDFRYQLTCVGGYAPVYVGSEISGNRVRIAGGRPGLKVSWQITGIRHDEYANAHRIPIEAVKPATERRTATSSIGPAPSLGTGGEQ